MSSRFVRLMRWLRWPFAAAGIAVVALIAFSHHREIRWGSAGPGGYTAPFVWVGRGGLAFGRERGMVFAVAVKPPRVHVLDFEYAFVDKRSRWVAIGVHRDKVHDWYFACPLWILALVSGLASWLGFAAKRRQAKPGECGACRYPLASAGVCPECGTPRGR